MTDAEFLTLSEEMLDRLADRLEAADAARSLEVECQHGMLSIELEGGKHLLVSRHTPMKQLWFSSPVSGGLHFSWDKTANSWLLPDGRELAMILSQEIRDLSDIEVAL